MNKEVERSIKLGFNGNLSKEFYKKDESVKRVRRKLATDLFGFSFFLFVLILGLISTDNIFIQLGAIIFICVITFAIIKNIALWNEIIGIEKERMIEYEKGNKYIN